VRTNAQFRHSLRVRVATSARQVGRTDVGFANQLAQWAVMGQQAHYVEPLGAMETRFRTRRQLRHLWQRILNSYLLKIADLVPLAYTLGISHDWLLNELKQARTFGALMEQIEQRQQWEGIWEKRWAWVEIEQAIACLRRRTYWLYKPEDA
jgi:hypothetical protein